MKIEIELITESTDPNVWKGWKVSCGDKYANGLTWDEMLGLIAGLTFPAGNPITSWLRSEAEHKAYYQRISNGNPF